MYYVAKGSVGRSSGARSTPTPSKPASTGKSTSNSSNSKSSGNTGTQKSSTPAPPPAKPKTSTKPTTATKTTTTSTPPKVGTNSSKSYSRTGYTVGDGYQPRFANGYQAPAGSTVYYRDHSFTDYLPWIYLFSQSDSPHYSNAAVIQPDGKEVEAKPAGGIDGLFILNWIVMIVLALAVIAGVIWLVNKYTNKTPKPKMAAVL